MLTLWIFNKVHSMSLQKPFLVKWKLILSDSLYSESRVTTYIKSYFFYPCNYLFVAIDYGAFRQLFHFCVITIVLFLIYIGLFGNGSFTSPLFLLILIFPSIIHLFPLPTQTADYGIKQDVEYVVKNVLEWQNIQSLEDLELIEKNIELFESKLQRRINFLRASLGMFWGLLVFYLGLMFRLSFQLQKAQTP